MYQTVPLTLTGPQLRKLSIGHPVQLSAPQLQPACKHAITVHPMTAKKIHTARMKGSGVRIQISPQELAMSGEGLGDIWNWVKTNVPKAASWAYENVPKAAKWAKENVIDTPFYQQNIRPKAHEFLEGQLMSKPYANYTVPGFEYLAEQTGAFGVRRRPKLGSKNPTGCSSSIPKPRAKSAPKRIGGSFRN